MSILNAFNFITSHPLNRDHKLQSILRVLKWQVGSRLVPGAIVFDWVNGAKLVLKPGDRGLTGNLYTGLHEFRDMAFLLHVLREDDLFVDIGANMGSYTILACAAIGARGRAFEPIPSTYERLVENIRVNALEDRVECFNLGLGNEKGSIAFTSGLNTVNHALAAGEQSDNAIDVDVTTLDEALGEVTPGLVKIDVEGFETPVLEGAQDILGRENPYAVIMELNGSGSRYGFDEARILEMMLDHGFGTHSYDPFERALIDLQGKNRASGNTLFIRRKSHALVLERLKTAPMVSVHGKRF